MALEYYRRVQNLLLDRAAVQLEIKAKERERIRMRDRMGPGDVKAIRYDYIPAPRAEISVYEQLEAIDKISREIDELKVRLVEIEEEIEELKRIGLQTAERLKSTTLKVFIGFYIQHKPLDMIATELDRGMDMIYKCKTEINTILREAVE